ncbi:hypothetical protein FHR38_002286 [Micromonospora polyrhachis]|uniref:Uncharacterized protein n=1 Tax=Micromonospora polyrhachis TaxID=1282883 RepID=A0A7W7SPH0_9ACTN|nr:hypothetical protein [Micromonospora polyrhachis]
MIGARIDRFGAGHVARAGAGMRAGLVSPAVLIGGMK